MLRSNPLGGFLRLLSPDFNEFLDGQVAGGHFSVTDRHHDNPVATLGTPRQSPGAGNLDVIGVGTDGHYG